jgi:hypothetical protein
MPKHKYALLIMASLNHYELSTELTTTNRLLLRFSIINGQYLGARIEHTDTQGSTLSLENIEAPSGLSVGRAPSSPP